MSPVFVLGPAPLRSLSLPGSKAIFDGKPLPAEVILDRILREKKRIQFERVSCRHDSLRRAYACLVDGFL